VSVEVVQSCCASHGVPSAQVDSMCGGFAFDFAKLHPRDFQKCTISYNKRAKKYQKVPNSDKQYITTNI